MSGTAGSEHLVVERELDAPPEAVFAAWTRPEHLLAWWGPHDVTCTDARVDLRVGGRYRLTNRLPDGSELVIFGTFTGIEEPHLLRYSWNTGPADAQTTNNDTASRYPTESSDVSVVEVTFEAVRERRGTLVRIVHQRIASLTQRDDHERGWRECLSELSAHLR